MVLLLFMRLPPQTNPRLPAKGPAERRRHLDCEPGFRCRTSESSFTIISVKEATIYPVDCGFFYRDGREGRLRRPVPKTMLGRPPRQKKQSPPPPCQPQLTGCHTHLEAPPAADNQSHGPFRSLTYARLHQHPQGVPRDVSHPAHHFPAPMCRTRTRARRRLARYDRCSPGQRTPHTYRLAEPLPKRGLARKGCPRNCRPSRTHHARPTRKRCYCLFVARGSGSRQRRAVMAA